MTEFDREKQDLAKTRSAMLADIAQGKQELASARATMETARQDAVNAANVAIRSAMPRGLTPEQQKSVIDAGKPFSGLTVNVWTLPSTTPDSSPLANLLGSLLKTAGWNVGGANALGGFAKGVLICVGENPKPNVEAAAIALVRALRAANIDSGIDPKQSPELQMASVGGLLPKPDVAIVIGSKP